MDRIDGKGFHPTARPYRPHWKRERSKLKATKIALSITKQLEVLWTKFGTYTTEKGERVLNKLIDLVVLDTNETYKEPMCGGDITWGAAGDFSMQHADPSRPPPKGWMQKFMRYAAVLFVGALMAFLNAACHKDPIPTPQPNPDQPTDTIPPTDTITPIIPTREIVIPWCWSSGDGLAPWMDTIKYYVQQPDVKHVIIYMVPGAQSTWEPRFFKIARDSLQTRFDVDTNKVIGDGCVKVGRDGAHIHPDTLSLKFGMWEPDSVWYTTHGFNIGRFAMNSK